MTQTDVNQRPEDPITSLIADFITYFIILGAFDSSSVGIAWIAGGDSAAQPHVIQGPEEPITVLIEELYYVLYNLKCLR
jgi:hypothetical protein